MKTATRTAATNRKRNGTIAWNCLAWVLLLCCSRSVYAQAPSSSRTADSVIEEKLVELALKGPEAQRVEHQNKVYEYQLKSAKNSWMNFLTLSANYNDQTFAQTANTAYVYPKYFFGLNIPLGTIISGKQAKIARETVAIGNLTQEEVKRKIRADVIGKYRQYKAQGEVITIETSYMNDLEAALTDAEDKFRKGTISFETYNGALKSRNDEKAKIINLKLEQDLTRLEIERIIGTNLETVVK
jgi:outer membrane protein TolC